MFDFLRKIFGVQLPPILSKDEISDFGKVSIFVGWFVRRDQAVNTFVGKASNIFRNGIFPSFWDRKSLKNILSKYSDSKEWPIGDWLIAKVFNDLNSPDKITKDYLKNFLGTLNEMNIKSTDKLWRIAQQYNLRSDNIIFEPEIGKITNEQDKMDFLQELIDAYFIGAEVRIFNWLYQKYFNEEYKPDRVEIEDVLRKWNKNSTEEVYWELMGAGTGEDIARRVISDKNLLDKYFLLRNQLRQKGVSNRDALLKIAMDMQDLIAKK